MNLDLTGKISLVTGGSRGIGRAVSIALAAAGSSVAIHYNKRKDLAEATVEDINCGGGQAITVAGDLGSAPESERVVKMVREAIGDVDILVNNAAEMTDFLVEQMPLEIWERCISLNLSAAFRLSRCCVPSMKERKWGRIVNVSSQAAFTGSAQHAHYSAAKAGLLGLTYSLVKELASYGITVNVVAPGRIGTDMVTTRMGSRLEEWMAQIPLKRFGEPEEVADAVHFLVSSSASYVTGAVIHVNGGMHMGG